MIQPRTPMPSPFPNNPMSPPPPFAALYTFLNLAKDEENIVNIKSLTVGVSAVMLEGGGRPQPWLCLLEGGGK